MRAGAVADEAQLKRKHLLLFVLSTAANAIQLMPIIT